MKNINKLAYIAIGMVLTLMIGMATPAFAAAKDVVKQLTAAFTSGGNPISIYVNGTKLNPKDGNGKDVAPFIVDGTTYLPVRAVANALGKDVTWDGATASVKITDKIDDTSVQVPWSNENSNAKLTTTKDSNGEYQDKLDYTFTPDEYATGQWKSLGFFNEISDFNPSEKPEDNLFWTGNTIYPDGSMTMYRAGGDVLSGFHWTKGYFVGWTDNIVPAYQIKQLNGKTYMFAEWKGVGYPTTGEIEGYYVFEKTASITMGDKSAKLTTTTNANGERSDSLDYKFTSDSNAVGEWKNVGWYLNMGDFNPKIPYDGKLFLKGMSIYNDGTMTSHQITGDDAHAVDFTGFHWTKGYIVDFLKSTSKLDVVTGYAITNINGKTYLFMEWKSMDYVKNGDVTYYVFEKTSDTPTAMTTK